MEFGEEFVSLEDEVRTELSYASARGSEYVAPLVENLILLPVPPPCHPCGSSLVAPALEEIIEEPAGAICEDLDALLQEMDEERGQDLQEGSSNLVVLLNWRPITGPTGHWLSLISEPSIRPLSQ